MTPVSPVTKTARQAQIAGILAQAAVRSQEELAEFLAQRGVRVTQATLSRDLDELGAVRLRGPDGALVYALPGEPGGPGSRPGGLAAGLAPAAARVEARGGEPGDGPFVSPASGAGTGPLAARPVTEHGGLADREPAGWPGSRLSSCSARNRARTWRCCARPPERRRSSPRPLTTRPGRRSWARWRAMTRCW